MDFKSVAGWLKIIGYGAAFVSLVMGFLDPKTALLIVIGLSAVVKFVETICKITPGTADDEFIAKVIEILKKNGLLKD